MKAADGINVWPIPILLGILTCVGLVAALVADGIWDAVSWIGLGLPVAVVVWFVWLAPDRRAAGGREGRK
jgi:hypothetical protein